MLLKKSFKPAKCKTALKLAMARIKLMRNKKGVQINQMKKELAQLLEKGDDRTARIRVEHVIREEKMVAAYDLIEIYCELIVARLPIIESQKTCPIDLKEAVASLVFAAPRCSDITELLDVKKSFTTKYGKEFATAATELRPACGVNHMLVEKLSAGAPDIQTKVKVLDGVAKEHNVKWDATSFEEKELKPTEDLLNGPTNFVDLSTINVDSPKVQTPTVNNVQNHQATPSVPADYTEQNRRYTSSVQNSNPADTVQSSYASTSHNDTRPTGMASGSVNLNKSYRSNSNNSSSGNENLMEFKDATSAAQAAAEAAERASYAARVAAQLSRQYSNESHDSHIRDERPQVSYNSSFNNKKSNIQNQQMGPNENSTSPKTTSKSSSSRSRYNSDEGSVNSTPREDRSLEIQKSSMKEPESGFRSDNDRSHSYNDSRRYDETNYDDDDHQGSSSPEVNLRQESKARFTSDEIGRSESRSPRSHPSTTRDGRDNKQKVSKRTGVDKDNHYSETKRKSSFLDDRRENETGSDDDDDDDDDNHGPKFDTGFDYEELEDAAKSFFPSPGRESSHPAEKPNIKHARYVDPSVKSDLSYGLDSESESGTVKSSFSGSNKLNSPRKFDTYSAESSPKTNPRKFRIELNDLVQTDDSDTGKDSPFGTLAGGLRNKSGLESSPKTNPRKSRIELNDLVQTDDSDTGKDSPFGTLAGGLRNKSGLKYPPYTRSDSPLSKKPAEESQSPVKADPTSKQGSFNSRQNRFDKKKPSDDRSSYESESEYYSDKLRIKASNTRSSFGPPDAYFHNDGSDFEEEASNPKRMSTSKANLGPQGVSRRTKGQVEPKDKTVISSPTEARAKQSRAEPTDNFKKHYSTQSPPEPRPYTARYKQEPSATIHEPKMSQPPSISPKKSPESGKNEALKTSVEANNVKKPSHVHPKLPDSDTIADLVKSLHRMNP